jgi:hypothetical protein
MGAIRFHPLSEQQLAHLRQASEKQNMLSKEHSRVVISGIPYRRSTGGA